MTVTKQQQLEWLAKELGVWPSIGGATIRMSSVAIGQVNNGLGVAHLIRMEEWRQERDKMSSKPEVDNSWHERGEFPPVGTICEMIDDKNTWLECEVISHKDGSCIGWIPSRKSPFYTYDKSEFRPIRTEREKAIDAVCMAISDVGEDGLLLIERLYDAGLLKLPKPNAFVKSGAEIGH